MKVQTKVCNPLPHLGFQSTNSDLYRISKSRPENSEAEMQACFLKLKDLVPTVPQDKKVSKVQLLQHVIDYILDLEVTLDFQPSLALDLLTATQGSPNTATTERRPLAESTVINTTSIHSQTRPVSEDFHMKDESSPLSC